MLYTTPFKRVLLGTALALGLIGSAAAADLQPLRVANQKSTIKALLEASGETRNVPYTIQWSEFPSASPLGEALNAGAVDIGALGDAPYVFALGAGASLKVVSIIHSEGRNTTALVVPKDSPIKTVADLKGKKIVTGRGSIGHYLAIKALATAGLTTRDVQFIFLLPSESRLVLDNGTADAWATWDPYTTVVTSQSQARVLVSGNKLLSNHLYLAATSQAIADKRPQLDDFVARVDRAYAWANTHPDEYAAAQARITGLPLDVHVTVAKDTRLNPVTIDDAVISGLQATADTYQQEGLLLKHIDVSQGFDKSFNAKRVPFNQASR
ncbi:MULTISPECIES: ABC transporter substrate-binding protein [Pseudomonas]|jgi:sulfonate transport system substrate-binding protein|uniref:Putative aliphatic sulfonates-binding protein n=1 Tax=Pseudomonas extremorientalis TaxID=169669 RepID=A0A1H0WN10_9PSED|nr:MULTISPECIES: ABC transporter substrate-binding protein [Pseudomonas]KAB0513521.1 ABC transporter substrate-binding protein [Pseudomonas extremorientalis]OIN08907.1 ABC transporter substrate-binding protein [Pseudomonas extremorientalis]QZP19226.1 ABC transporter substrate-binding protein [Pseudomonas sp. DR208]UUN91084.1 ABC transporter substrate-binding protein [Pseudomonas extremorientalis]WLG59222.1 ABC transporter substrate-binding protein [Pseudomonas extremorientalis]